MSSKVIYVFIVIWLFPFFLYMNCLILNIYIGPKLKNVNKLTPFIQFGRFGAWIVVEEFKTDMPYILKRTKTSPWILHFSTRIFIVYFNRKLFIVSSPLFFISVTLSSFTNSCFYNITQIHLQLTLVWSRIVDSKSENQVCKTYICTYIIIFRNIILLWILVLEPN